MLDPASLEPVAIAAGTTLLTAMTMDSWNWTRQRVARLFGRGRPEAEQDVADRLEQSRRQIARDPDEAADEEAYWQRRFLTVMQRDPSTVPAIQELIARIGGTTQLAGRDSVAVSQTIYGDHNYVLGHGTLTTNESRSADPAAAPREPVEEPGESGRP